MAEKTMEGQFSIFDIYSPDVFASVIPSDVIDNILRTGGNERNTLYRIVYNYMIEQTAAESADFLKHEYGTGGKGFVVDGQKYSVWFDASGLQVVKGTTVLDKMQDSVVLSWNEVSEKIQTLLRQGDFVQQDILDAAKSNEITETAQKLWYLEREVLSPLREKLFPIRDMFSSGFPSDVQKITEFLSSHENIEETISRLQELEAAYDADSNIVRWPGPNDPHTVRTSFDRIAKDATPFFAVEGFSQEKAEQFVTDDVIDSFLSAGSPHSDGRLTTVSFYEMNSDPSERAEFLKNQYGIGGSGRYGFNSDYNAKGITLEIGASTSPDATISLRWPEVAKRIDNLISSDRYLRKEDYKRMPEYEREKIAREIVFFYDRLPENIERPYNCSIFNWNDAIKKICGDLTDSEKASTLYRKMQSVFNGLPSDTKDYEKKKSQLSEIKGYLEGSYTLFPKHEIKRKTISLPEEPPVKQAIPEDKVKGVSLLSVEEADNLPDSIRNIGCDYWLRTAGRDDDTAAFVDLNGYVYDGGDYINACEYGVRPVLSVDNIEPGKSFEGFGYSWTKMDNGKLLCDSVIAYKNFDSVSNNWETSAIKVWTENWLDKQLTKMREQDPSTPAVSALYQIGVVEAHNEPTKEFYTNRRGNRVAVTKSVEYVNTQGFGKMPLDEWYEKMESAVREDGLTELSDRITDYVVNHLRWFKKEPDARNYALKCLSDKAYLAWDDFDAADPVGLDNSSIEQAEQIEIDPADRTAPGLRRDPAEEYEGPSVAEGDHGLVKARRRQEEPDL